jgi:hypothetical protein
MAIPTIDSSNKIHLKITLRPLPCQTTAARVCNFVKNPANIGFAIFEGIFLYADGFDLKRTAKIMALATALDLASHVSYPSIVPAHKSLLSTFLVARSMDRGFSQTSHFS